MRFNTASDQTCTEGRPQEATNDAQESGRMMHKNDALESAILGKENVFHVSVSNNSEVQNLN